ncbi:MAG: sulfatase-like hydrolase/transferase [Clostridium sp.]|nr:sulfatase-like hydrolase/transferase [Clostridium sp.]
MIGFVTYSVIIVYLELIFHIAVYQSVDIVIIYPVLFAIAAGMGIFAFLNILPGLAGKLLGCVVVAIVSFYYMAQLIYFKIFNTFLSLVSIGGAENAMNFKSVLFDKLWENMGWIAAFILPVAAIILLNVKNVIKNTRLKGNLIGFGSCILAFLLAVLSLNIHGRGAYSPYCLFHENYILELSMSKLGVAVTTVRDGMCLLGQKDDRKQFVMSQNEEPVGNDENSFVEGNKTDNEKTACSGSIGTVFAETEGKTPPIVLYEQQIDESIDFAVLYDQTEDEDLKNITAYLSETEPSYKNKYTGMFQDYNVVFVTAESLSRYGISDTCTPTLYKLMNDGFVFDNFYNPMWYHSTIDGEYVNCLSQYPASSDWSFYKSEQTYQPYALGNILNEQGYDSYAYHDFDFYYYDRSKTHANMGYDFKAIGYGLDIPCYVMYSDIDMVEAVYGEFIDKDKFNVYFMTFSGHLPYDYRNNSMCVKNREEAERLTKDMGLSEEAVAYIAGQMELDKALELLIDKLDEAGRLEDTLFIVTPDHYPYGLSERAYDELSGGRTKGAAFELHRSCLGIWNVRMEEPIYIDKLCASVDVLPTILNLLGAKFDSRLLAGRDILSDAEPLVIFADHSFMNDKINYNTATGDITYLTDEKALEEHYLEDMVEQVENRLYISDLMIDKDYFSFVYKKGK